MGLFLLIKLNFLSHQKTGQELRTAIQHCAMAACITKLVLMFIVFVHDDSALFTIYICRGAEREGSWDPTLFVGEGNKTYVL